MLARAKMALPFMSGCECKPDRAQPSIIMKTLYFDCFSGISGDMTIGALLDLGLDFGYLKTELGKLPVEGYELKVCRVTRSNLSATKFDVLVEGMVDHHHHHHDHDHHHGHFHRK